MSQNNTTNPFTIPPHVHNQYTAHYNNQTYRAVRQALDESARYGQLSAEQSDDSFITEAMNGLINASFERCDPGVYTGAEAQLLQQISHLDSRLTTLVRLHLANFGSSPLETNEQALKEAILATKTAANTLMDIHAWRSMVSYWWTTAALQLLDAAYFVLIRPQETVHLSMKLKNAVTHILAGLTEIQEKQTDAAIAGIRQWLKQIINSHH